MSTKKRVSKVDIQSSDELAMWSDDEIYNRIGYMTSELSKRDGSVAHEVEICYAQREQQIREIRRQQHNKYINSIRVAEANEYSYPEYEPTPPPPYWSPKN